MRRNGGRLLAGAVGACALALTLTAASAGAKTFEVTRHNDPAPGKCKADDCSLREAIRAANAHSGKDVVVLPDRARYELKRANAAAPVFDEDESLRGDLDVTGKLTLSHPGKGRATIDASGIDRVLDVLAATVVKRVKLTGGDNSRQDPPTPPRAARGGGQEGDGGGIIMHAPLTLTRSSVVGNGGADYGGGIESYPLVKGNLISLALRRSTVARNATTDGVGGGIDSIETRVSLVRSKVVGNDAENAGGGVSVFSGSLRMSRTTVAGNDSETGAGGVYLGESPTTIANSTISANTTGPNANTGGIDASDGALAVTNSTVAGNSAGHDGGGIRITGATGDLVLRSSTVARNLADSNGMGGGIGGGLSIDGGASAAVVNSIIALNRQGATPSDCAGGFDTGGGNLLSTGNGCNLLGVPAGPDFIGVNPKLAQLARNGGPTQTVALKKGSPAIGKAVKSAAPERDQRGVKRDGKPDIGAYER